MEERQAAGQISYRLPQLLASPHNTPIYFVEGEKCADALAKIEMVATTQSEGANAPWHDGLTQYFKGRHVIILPDADDSGRVHGCKVAKAIDGVAASVRVVDLYPDRTDGSDVWDWLQDDPTGARLAQLGREAPIYDPSTHKGAESDSSEDDNGLIGELAALSRLAYAKRRRDAAKRLGVGLGALDKIVAEARDQGGDVPAHWLVEWFPDPVVLADLLDDLRDLYDRHVVLPEGGAVAMEPRCAHAWALRRGLLFAAADVCQPGAALRQVHGFVGARPDRSAHRAGQQCIARSHISVHRSGAADAAHRRS